MVMQVTMTFDVETDDYSDVETPEQTEELVRSMLKGEADWPWEAESDDGPKITVTEKE
jgi:hypothetical protein